jgi:hypothetical protein
LALTICTTPDEGSGAPGINTATLAIVERVGKEPTAIPPPLGLMD